MMFRLPLIVLCALLTPFVLFASGTRIDVRSVGQGQICLELEWEHAWNMQSSPGNHDALWIFLKYRGADRLFHHLSLQNGHVSSGSASIHVSPDGVGAFVYMPEGHSGSTGTQQVCVLYDDVSVSGVAEIQAFAVEMVHVEAGGYWLGDSLSNGTMATAAGAPLWVENELMVPQIALQDTGAYKPEGDIPQSWPKGTGGFYCMKYEVSMKQYADFLNTLTYEQQVARTAVSPSSARGTLAMSSMIAARNSIRILSPGSSPGIAAEYGLSLNGSEFEEGAQGEHRACNWLSWDDLTAYLDWAGLRPMTEWEFEKVCRGPQPWISGEFAWGTDQVVDGNTLLQDGTAFESVAERGDSLVGLASHGYDGPQGPLRTGFAANDSTERVSSGASFWGVMELSGNLWEQCVTVNVAGLEFAGELGDGNLDALGSANQPTWPGAEGGGYRGGGWNSGVIPGFNDLAVSDRFYAGMSPQGRRATSGGRGVR